MREGREIAMKMAMFGVVFAALFVLMLWDIEPERVSIMASADDQALLPPKPPSGYIHAVPIYTTCSGGTLGTAWVATSQ